MLETIAHIFVATLAILLVLVVYLAVTSVWIVPQDKMLAYFFLRVYVGVFYSSGTYEKRRKAGNLPADVLRAHTKYWLRFGNIVILPWPFWQGVYLPTTTEHPLRYHSARIYTRNDIPLFLEGTVTLQLDGELSDFLETFNVLGKGYDLAREYDVSYLIDRKAENGEEIIGHYKGTCLDQIILDATTSQFREALRHVASQHTFADLKGNIKGMEAEIRYYLAAPESPFSQGGILGKQKGDPKAGTADADPGPAVRKGVAFDINLPDITPMDQTFFNALSAPATAALQADARREQRKGEGDGLKEYADRSGVSAKEILRNETVREVDEMTVVAAGETFSAVIGGLLAGRGGGPRTGTRRRRGNQPPQQTPPQTP